LANTGEEGISMTVRHFTSKDARYHQYLDREIFVGDVLDSSNSGTMSVGFYRNKRKGDKNEWVVTYDEALIVTKGALTIRFAEGAKTAKAGEVIFLTKGTEIAYEAAEDDTEAVYVSYPHWMDAQQKSEHAHLLDSSPIPPMEWRSVSLARQFRFVDQALTLDQVAGS
jgi:ethanolamine utilization protein EutQ